MDVLQPVAIPVADITLATLNPVPQRAAARVAEKMITRPPAITSACKLRQTILNKRYRETVTFVESLRELL